MSALGPSFGPDIEALLGHGARPADPFAGIGPRWVAWCEELRDGKKAKPPRDPATGRMAKTDNPSTWASRARAETRARELLKGGGKGGIGIMLGDLGDRSHLCGVDLDGCRDPATGDLESWAATIVAQLGSYAEVSPSQEGVKVFFRVRTEDLATFRAALGGDSKSAKRGSHHGIEVYAAGRYFTTTFDALPGAEAMATIPSSRACWLAKFVDGWKHKASKAKGLQTASRDESRSAVAFRFLLRLASAGVDEATALELLAEDGGDAGEWAGGASERDLERAWDGAVRHVESVAQGVLDLLDEESDDVTEASGASDETTVESFSLDHDGVIRAFVRHHRDRLRFDHDVGKWFCFGGSHWQRESTKLAHEYARKASLARAKADPTNPAVKVLKSVQTWEAVERGARPDRAFAVGADTWDRDPMLLGTPGGTVNLTTGELRPADPADCISKVTAVAPIPLAAFDPERHCPTWMRFLSDALNGDQEAIRFLQQWGGYSLTGDTREQVLVFVYGPGGSGKGTAINTIGDILGDYSVNVGMETLTASKHDRHTTELARLKSARMARASETEKGRGWAENRIKTLTGQDTITARFMRQDDFEFVPEFKLTVFGNNQPALTDVDAAIKRRFIVIPFDHPPAVKDVTLSERLRAEWPGILTWLIGGCLDWQANGLQRPRVVEAATAAYFATQNDFGQWLDDRCEVEKGAAATTDALWQSWQRYARDNGIEPGSKKKTFPEKLAQEGFEAIKDTNGIRGRGWRGLRLQEEDLDEDLDEEAEDYGHLI